MKEIYDINMINHSFGGVERIVGSEKAFAIRCNHNKRRDIKEEWAISSFLVLLGRSSVITKK